MARQLEVRRGLKSHGTGVPMWVLRTEPRSSERATAALDCRAIFSALVERSAFSTHAVPYPPKTQLSSVELNTPTSPHRTVQSITSTKTVVATQSRALPSLRTVQSEGSQGSVVRRCLDKQTDRQTAEAVPGTQHSM